MLLFWFIKLIELLYRFSVEIPVEVVNFLSVEKNSWINLTNAVQDLMFFIA